MFPEEKEEIKTKAISKSIKIQYNDFLNKIIIR